MADRKKISWLDNLKEDFGWMGDPASLDLPEWLQMGIGENEYQPKSTPPAEPTPADFMTAEEKAQYALAKQMGDERMVRQLEGAANGRMGGNGLSRSPSPDAMTMPPEMGIAPLDGVSTMGLTGGDMPVTTASPDRTRAPKADAVADIAKSDATRGGGLFSGAEDRYDELTKKPIDREYPENSREAVAQGVMDDPYTKQMPVDMMTSDRARAAAPAAQGPGNQTIPVTQIGLGGLERGLTGGTDRELLPPELDKSTFFTGDRDDYYDRSVPTGPSLGMTHGTGLTEAVLPPALIGTEDDPTVDAGGSTGGADTKVNTEMSPVDNVATKPNSLNALQQFTQDKFGWDEDKRGDMSEALMSAGFAMMAGDSPYAMQNIGKGGLVGVQAYQGSKDQRRKEGLEEDALAMQKELHQLRLAEGSRAAEKHEIAKKKAAQIAAQGPEFDPKSPVGKMWADANAIANSTPGVTAEEVLQTWINQGWQKDPREKDPLAGVI